MTNNEERNQDWPVPKRQRGEDPFNLINSVLLERGEIAKRLHDKIPEDAFSYEKQDEKKCEDEPEERKPEKIHPVLQEWLESRPEDEAELIIISFRDDLRIPRFPDPNPDEPRDSRYNQEAMKRADALVEELTEQRAGFYEEMAAELRQQYDLEVINTFWIINAMLVKMPLGAVPRLAERRDVLYLEPENAGEEPPQNEVDNGRARIVSDPYFNLGLTGGYIGLLDTGLRFSHTLFNSPSNIDFRFDCTDGTCDGSPDPSDDCWNHGTSTAAIISGNNNLGNDYRGITGITLDSFKVYPAGCGGLSGTATVKAFEKAVAVLDRVIVAEMQGGGSDTSAISNAADGAFDAGAVIIAANGNNGPNESTVNTPANAHKAIGVGNFDVQSLNQINSQSRGPAPDNRFKPDIQAPTNTETASSASDTALKVFGGTSGATPYAAGAAALLRNWLRGASFSIDPGQVYAQLILSGQDPYPFNNTRGAGPIELPTNGWAWWGKVAINNGGQIDIPLNLSGSSLNTFDAALWWPETPAQAHNDIDLYLIDPGGISRDYSYSIPSVFERAHVPGSIAAGTWKLRIRGYSVPAGPQTVYWAAHVRLH